MSSLSGKSKSLLSSDPSTLWISGAEKVVESSRDEIIRSCKLALALQRLLDEEEATIVMGDVDKLWQNWTGGLHRVTCYGDLTQDLKRFCRFTGLELINEAV
ncbi:MAG: hypothetical protein ACK40X_01435 [Armatimonadota bacterium]